AAPQEPGNPRPPGGGGGAGEGAGPETGGHGPRAQAKRRGVEPEEHMGSEERDPDGAVRTSRNTARSATRGEWQRRHCPVAGDARQLITAGLGDPDSPASVRGDAV